MGSRGSTASWRLSEKLDLLRRNADRVIVMSNLEKPIAARRDGLFSLGSGRKSKRPGSPTAGGVNSSCGPH